MATYKVLQDIEAEDHILGPLSLRQFIYGLITAFCLYLSFLVFTKGAAFLMVIFLPPALFFGFLAFPFGRDQPTEVWALAKLRFFVMPRKRIWDQTGIKELVTINAPKRIEHSYTDGLSQHEVKSRLKALANTIDSRGWAVKNVNVNMYRPPTMERPSSSERLIDINNIPQAVPEYDVQPSDDILDETSNPVAQQVNQMMGANAQARRQQLINELNTPGQAKQQAPADYWFLNQPATPPQVPDGNATFAKPQVVLPGQDSSPAAGDDMELSAQLKQSSPNMSVATNHLRTIQPAGKNTGAPQPVASETQSTTTSGSTPDPAILELANNNDFNVSTLARQAKKAKGEDSDGEVVVPLR
jgi:hypothetical protein